MNWQIPHELPDLRRVGIIAIDTEENDEGLRAGRGSGWPWHGGHICGISVAWREGDNIRGQYIPLRHPDSDNFHPALVFGWLKELIASGVRIVTQNGIYDWGWLRAEAGIVMPPSDRLEEIGALATMIDENRFSYSLDALCGWIGLPGKNETQLAQAVKAAGYKITESSPLQSYIWRMPAQYVEAYAVADAVNTLMLFECLNPMLDKEGTRDAYRLEVDLLPMVLEMRLRGIRVGSSAAEQARDLLLVKRDATLTEISALVGSAVGMAELGRNKWKAQIFDRYGIDYPRTALGNPSFTAGSTGWMHKHAHPLPQLIVRASKAHNAATKFLETYILGHVVDGRIHAEIHPHRSDDGGTRSLRFSYSSPPMQQMTSHDEELAPLIRGCFLPEESEWWASSDVSQQEFRNIVHYAVVQDLPKAKQAAELYRTDPDTDFHQLVADWTGLERSSAKNTNFAKAFGAGVAKFAAMIGKSEAEAREIYDKYDRELPFVKRLSQRCQSLADRLGYLELYDGARRHWDAWEAPEIAWSKGMGPCSREEAERRVNDPAHPWYHRYIARAETYKAMNALIQGTAARHTKLWMRACWREGIVPLLMMHDELDISMSSAKQAERVQKLGCEVVKLEVPMKVDLKFGRNWGDARHEWKDLNGAALIPKGIVEALPSLAVPESVTDAPIAVLENTTDAPLEVGVCAQCQLDPPDGSEQPWQLEGNEKLWMHPRCKDAFIHRRLAEEGMADASRACSELAEGDGQLYVIDEPSPPRPAATPPVREKASRQPPPSPLEIELVKLTNASGPLTKQISLLPDGTLLHDKSACVMFRGTAERVTAAGVAALGALIEELTPSQALALGSLRVGLPDKVDVVVERKLNGASRPDLMARTGSDIDYRGPAFVLLDFDTKAMPASVKDELARHGGFWPALLTALPALEGAAHLARSSTSAGLSRTDTGAILQGSDGQHVYLMAKDGADAERFLRALHERCWLAGFGWMRVDAAGNAQERSIVDRMVGGPERLAFEGGPILMPPLVQDKASRRPIAVEGTLLDTLAVCPELTLVEKSRLNGLKAKERERLAPELAKTREAYVEKKTREKVANGMSEAAARASVIRQCEGVLRPDVELPFDDPALAGKTVGDVLDDPERFEGETLADPLKGAASRRCVAKIMRRADGTPFIHSFAHGRTIYHLRRDAASVAKEMEKAEAGDVVKVFASLSASADLDEIELETLRQQAKELSGVGLRVINATLKAAKQKQATLSKQAAQQRQAASRQDPRPQIEAPFPDAPWLPQMAVLNEVLGAVGGDTPPTRDADDDMMSVRKISLPGTHALTSASAAACQSEELPAPEQWALCKMSEMEVAELIEKHIDFYTVDKDGCCHSVHLLTPFVRHYLRRDDGALPTTVAFATMPIVLADGSLLAPTGLDRLRGIQFLIPDELRAVVPSQQDCTKDAVKAALAFLYDDWLVDVAADHTGKALLIATALTLLERSLLEQRPCFFITAGKRGNGKTTTIEMLISAVIGDMPAASAWSSNEEERRKALLSHFISGAAYVLWDNIPRGLQIACPHIERSCTAAYYSDRRLGVSEIARTSASTIHIFTGNNIGPKGDLASRSLHIRLAVDRADPENRTFTHTNPIAWGKANRGRILGALYTILLGNPQLKQPHDAEGKTRYKMWWRLVGSAVEHAAALAGHELDFKKLFIEQEGDDEEATSLADGLEILLKKWPETFAAKDVSDLISTSSPNEEEQTLRDVLYPIILPNQTFTAKSVSSRLKQRRDEPVRSGERTLVLRAVKDPHTKVVSYSVKVIVEAK